MFLLARELGYTVDELLDRLGPGEIDYWFEIHKEQPLGDPWFQTGLICSTVANFNPWGTKRRFKAEDFMPQQRKPMSPKMAREAFRLAMASLGRKIIPKKRPDA